jgi:macrocin-O-methyltransferase TylF-like protien
MRGSRRPRRSDRQGFFEDSLTSGLAQRVGKVAFASLDADLYSSTLCALTWLTPLLVPGSLLLFDEYLGDNRAEQRAHVEWQQATGTRTEEVFRHYRVPVLETPDERVLFRVTD